MLSKMPGLTINWETWRKFSFSLRHQLKYIYLVYIILMVIMTANLTPGFQVPDERAHFLRAEQISRGVWVATFISQLANGEHRTSPDKRTIYPDSGGYIGNPGINQSAYEYEEIVSRPERKVNSSMIQKSRMYNWKSDLAVVNFPNTGFYPPVGYLLPAIGIIIGKLTHMPVLDTLIFSRILNGIGCGLICFFALGMATRSRVILFFLLLLPLTISLFASVSQDGMLISLAALMVALIDHVESSEKRIYTTPHLVILMFCITALSVARPPYFLLIAVFLFLHLPLRMKLVSIIVPFLLICFWGLLNARNYNVAFAPAEMQVNAKLQMAYVMSHPFRFIGFFFHFNMTEIMDKLREYIGVLGWLDLVLPGYYYKLAFFMLFLTALMFLPFNHENWKLRGVFIAAACITFVAIMAAQYITWMPLESPGLGGVQSRYFIPVIFCLVVGIAGFGKEQSIKNWQIPIFLLVVLFPLVTQLVMVNSFILRYYLN